MKSFVSITSVKSKNKSFLAGKNVSTKNKSTAAVTRTNKVKKDKNMKAPVTKFELGE